MIRIAVLGASGRMGRRVIANVLEGEGLMLVAAVTRPDRPRSGPTPGSRRAPAVRD